MAHETSEANRTSDDSQESPDVFAFGRELADVGSVERAVRQLASTYGHLATILVKKLGGEVSISAADLEAATEPVRMEKRGGELVLFTEPDHE